jgi:hypothetical protein
VKKFFLPLKLISLLLITPADAALITYQFTGHVTDDQGLGPVPTGALITGYFQYDTNTITGAPAPIGGSGTQYSPVTVSVDATYNGSSFWSRNGVSDFIIGDDAAPPYDRFDLWVGSNLSDDLFSMNLRVADGTLSNHATVIPDFEDLFNISIYSEAGFCGINACSLGVLDTLTHVPIPAAAWLFGSGLLGLIGVARKNAA